MFSALVVKAGLTVQTMHSVSMTRVSTSELNWAASWTRPSRMLGRKGCRTWVLSDSFSWSQYLEKIRDVAFSVARSYCYYNLALLKAASCSLEVLTLSFTV